MRKAVGILRWVGAVLAGVVAGVVIVMLANTATHQVWPVADPSTIRDPAALKTFVSNMPFGALATIVVGWVLGAYIAAFAALLISGRRRFAGVAAGGVMLLLTAINLAAIPHPGWMAATGLGGILLAIWLADALFARPKAA